MVEEVKSLVFFDMDGTLLSSRSTIFPEVAEAIKQMGADGHIPVICTGRAAFEVRLFMRECEIGSIISMNGQYIEFEKQIVSNQAISSELCGRVLKYAKSRNDIVGFYNYQQIAISEDQPLSRQFYQNIASPFPKVNDEFYKSKLVNQLLIISHHADTEYARNFPELEFFITGEQSIDTVIKGNSKGEGIKKMLAEKNLRVPTYAFGDGINDLTMFNTVDYGIAMENGRDEIKKLASYVTDTNDNLGVVKGLKKIGLI